MPQERRRCAWHAESRETPATQLAHHVDRECIGERQDVLDPLTERRHRDDVEGQAIEQIFAEPTIGVDHRCRSAFVEPDDAHVDRDRVAAADALQLSVLDDPQNLLLHPERDTVASSSSTSVPPSGALEMADVGPGGARKCAGLVAEQLGFEDRLGQCGAVDLDQRLFPAAGQEMKPGGDQFLAGAALADDQDGLDRGSARDTCSSISRNAGASPMIGCEGRSVDIDSIDH